MKNKRLLKISTFITVIAFLFNVSVASALEPVAEVYYRASGTTSYSGADSFETDLNEAIKTKLYAPGVAIKYVNIMDANLSQTNAIDLTSWDKYSHTGYASLNTATAISKGLLDVTNPDHIQITNSGLTMNFFGYPDHAHKDFLLYKSPSVGKKVFTFKIIEESMDYHTVEGGGFLFNISSNAGILNGYTLLLGQSDIRLFQLTNVSAAALSDETTKNFKTGDYGAFPGITQVGDSVAKPAVNEHNIKIIASASNIKMWDNGTLLMDRALSPIAGGESFGPIASYTSHGCPSLSIYTFDNIKMYMANPMPFETALHQVPWDKELRYFVNIDDSSAYFNDATSLASIVSDINSSKAEYIGLGDTTNEAINTSFITTYISSAGIYVDSFISTSAVTIDQVATYIVNGILGYRNEIVAIEDLESNGISYAAGDNANSVSTNLTLLTGKSVSGTTVTSTWTSSNTAVIGNDGSVTTPSISTGPVTVTLTELIAGEHLTSTAIYTVIVKPKPVLTLTSEGNGEISFSFSIPAGASSVVLKQSTNGSIYTNATTAALNGSSSLAISTGLTNNQTYFFKLLVDTYYSNIVTGTPKSQTSSTHSNPPATIILVNGESQNAGTQTQTLAGGVKTITVDVNENTINQKIDAIIGKTPTNNPVENLIEIPVNGESEDSTKVILTGDLINKMEKNDFTLKVSIDTIGYLIPSADINIMDIAKKLASTDNLANIELFVNITQPNAATLTNMATQAKAKDYEIIIPPMDFEIKAINTKTKEEVTINKFSNYVQRIFEVPAGIDPSKITTGIVYNTDGTFSHVPTEIVKIGNKYYAKLNSLTNSTYSVIENTTMVSSVEKHWSKKAVNDMAARLVISNPESFKPEDKITRGEFAEYITKALGIYRTGVATDGLFKDVTKTNTLGDAITTAVKYGIINGYTDGNFKPTATITRQEAMVMYNRAMKIVKLSGTDLTRINNYTDSASISNWAKEDVKQVLAAKVFNGVSSTKLAPTASFTKAEAATAVRNLLIQSGLINN